MFKLRQTWSDVFPKKLYALDVRVQSIDPAWPITAPPPTASIHLNPAFLPKVGCAAFFFPSYLSVFFACLGAVVRFPAGTASSAKETSAE